MKRAKKSDQEFLISASADLELLLFSFIGRSVSAVGDITDMQ